MIIWKNERTQENFCGYCIGSPPSANCDGSCFTDERNFGKENVKANRKNHLLNEIAKIPDLLNAVQSRKSDLEEELAAIG